MNRVSSIINLALTIALALVLVACGDAPHDGPGSTTLGVAQVEYQSWNCEGGLVLFRDALIGNQGETKGHYDQWLSPIPCESAGRYLQD